MRPRTVCLILVALMSGCSDSSPGGDAALLPDSAQDGAPGDTSPNETGPGDTLQLTDHRINDLQPGTRRVFITSDKLDGDLGGLAGADTRCAQAAVAAGIGGTWVAWLSTKTEDAIDRLKEMGPWHDLTGKRIFVDKAALADFTSGPENGLWVDENGSAMGSDKIWTGTGPDGRYVTSIGDSCQGWTSSAMSDQARIGQVGRSDYAWTSQSFTTCDQSNLHLICFEQ